MMIKKTDSQLIGLLLTGADSAAGYRLTVINTKYQAVNTSLCLLQ
jgi:hypothetical protein